MPHSTPKAALITARLPRRLAAIFYDSLLVLALWMATTAVLVIYIAEGTSVQGFAYQLMLYLEAFGFYLLFWRLKGQTLGMQVWKIRLVTKTGEKPTYRQCLVRFLVATVSLCCIGLGFLWMLWDPRGETWQDKLSGTRIIYLGKDAYTLQSDFSPHQVDTENEAEHNRNQGGQDG